MSKQPAIPDDAWPCACLKRDRQGNMTHIKLHPRTTRKCATCKSPRPPAAWFDQDKVTPPAPARKE